MILSVLKGSDKVYNVTADGLLYLKSQGVSQTVILALLHSGSAGTHQTAPSIALIPATTTPPVKNSPESNLWRIAEASLLQGDDTQFSLVLEPTLLKEHRGSWGGSINRYTMRFTVSSQTPMVQFLPAIAPNDENEMKWLRGDYGMLIRLDTSNSEEMEALKKLLPIFEIYVRADNGVKRSMRAQASSNGLMTYSGSLGESVITFDSPDYYGLTYIIFGPRNYDRSTTGASRGELPSLAGLAYVQGLVKLYNATALGFALNSLPEIRALHRKAIEEKEQRLAAEQAAATEAAKHEVDQAKAASAQRIRDFQAQEAAKYGAEQKALDLVAITNNEAAEKERIANEYATKAREKVLAFLRTDEGWNLDKQIQNQITAIQKKQNEEMADINEKKAKLAALMQTIRSPEFFALSPVERTSISEQVNPATYAIMAAQARYRESDTLKKMRNDLQQMGDKFKLRIGIAYDDAKELIR